MGSILTKTFSWSWSKLKNYRTCPKRHYEIDLARNFHEGESEALLWGNEVHKAMAETIAKGTPLPNTMTRFADWPGRVAKLKTLGLDVSVENSLAMDNQLQPCGYRDWNNAWFRCKIDVQILVPAARAALTIDWKTGGKVEPEFEQLGLSAQAIFAHHADVDQVAAIYVWIGHDTQTVKVYDRGSMAGLWNGLFPEIQQMAEAHRTLTYPPKPSGLCVRYCPVTSCPYHGKGSR